MVCTASLLTDGTTHGVVVPQEAVMPDENGNSFVYRVDTTSRKASRIYVKLGTLVAKGTEIANGLNKNDLVVVAGQHKLVDQSPVHIVN
ncbi:MAG TPA: efflux RND transporter periplasmic adaptor subunit, partial [Bacteroidota bacterium]|nr:efflux RND transporter periplasmic adaptor subunit [Bacteroidota bacterium]